MNPEQLKEKLRTILTSKGHEHPKFAVVVPIVYDENGARLLIEVRAEGIFQAGDPCFPGGKIEAGETSGSAAVREMYEELGIRVKEEELLGQLPSVRTRLGDMTNVFVCVITPEEAKNLRFSEGEVARLLDVPLEFFLARPYDSRYYVDGADIWGMTAGAIRHLCSVWKEII